MKSQPRCPSCPKRNVSDSSVISASLHTTPRCSQRLANWQITSKLSSRKVVLQSSLPIGYKMSFCTWPTKLQNDSKNTNGPLKQRQPGCFNACRSECLLPPLRKRFSCECSETGR